MSRFREGCCPTTTGGWQVYRRALPLALALVAVMLWAPNPGIVANVTLPTVMRGK